MARRDYYFVDPTNVCADDAGVAVSLQLVGEECRHLKRVLRHQPGDTVWATDGDGHMFRCCVEHAGKEQAVLRVQETLQEYGEPQVQLTLAQAMHKPQRFEFLLEKGTEIGISAFQPMRTDFTQVTLTGGKLARWQRVLKAAVKQCGRSRLPAVGAPVSFRETLQAAPEFGVRLIAHSPPPAGATLWADARPVHSPGKILLLVGPEGGFSETELAAAVQAGFSFLTLGPRRLRAETAGLVASALVLAQFGEMGGVE